MENQQHAHQGILPPDVVLRIKAGIPFAGAFLLTGFETQWGQLATVPLVTGIVAVALAPAVRQWADGYHLGDRIGYTVARLRGLPLPDLSQNDDPYQARPVAAIAAPVPQTPALAPVGTMQLVQGGPRRLTVSEIVSMTEYNSFRIPVGSSLTQPGNPPLKINFYKKHLKLIGVSQKGKSSMAAALLDIIVRTHDPSRVLLALLDMEDQTSNLFARVPNLAQININNRAIPLHARTEEQCLEYLGYIVEVMKVRYDMTKVEIMNQPLLIVYLEEFLRLKKYFKTRMESAPSDKKDQYKADYVRFVDYISAIASRGLKARVQLLLCAQVSYRDDDLQESLINVNEGLCFSLLPTAASAAGFYNTELVARNAQESKVGQAVIQTNECNDLLLAPDYDLEARLVAMEQAEMEEELRRDPYKPARSTKSTILTPVNGQREFTSELAEPVKERATAVLTLEQILALSDKVDSDTFMELVARMPSHRSDTAPAIEQVEPPLLSEKQQKVLVAYEQGIVKVRDIEREIGVGRTTVSEILRDLRKRGLVGQANPAEEE